MHCELYLKGLLLRGYYMQDLLVALCKTHRLSKKELIVEYHSQGVKYQRFGLVFVWYLTLACQP